MAKFIEIHAYGTKALLNLDSITGIIKSAEGGSVINFTDGSEMTEIEESYYQIREMIGAAQGGIPINHGRCEHG